MSNYDRRLQRLEDQYADRSVSNRLVFPLQGETDEAAKKRMGIDSDVMCLVIRFVSGDEGLL